MASVCKICAGPIEPLDQHLHASPAWAWPTPRRRWTSPTVDLRGPRAPGPPRCGSRPVRGGAHCRQRAAGEPPLSWRRERRLAVPSNPTVAAFPISFPEDCFRPPSNIEGFVAFGHEEGDEAMSISASEKEVGLDRSPSKAAQSLQASRRSS